MNDRPAARQTAIRAIMAPIAEMLPSQAPGITVRAVHARLDQYAPGTVRIALALLERDGIAASVIAAGAKGMPTRYFWRAAP